MVSMIVSVHGWDTLVSTANACCVQLLHDVSDSVYIAVGYTLHAFYELERLLLSLCASVASCYVTAKLKADSAVVQLPDDNPPSSLSSTSVDSADVSSSVAPQTSVNQSDSKLTDTVAAVVDGEFAMSVDIVAEDVDCQSKTSSHVSNVDSAENKSAAECRRQLFTRSGRPVKSKNFTDFTSSDTTVKRSSTARAQKTSLKQRRGRSQGRGKGRVHKPTRNRSSSSDGKYEEIVEESIGDVDEASSSQQQLTDECCEQQPDNTATTTTTTTTAAAAAAAAAAGGRASDVTVDHGTVSFCKYYII